MPGGQESHVYSLTHGLQLKSNPGPHPPPSLLAEWHKISDPAHPSERRGWDIVIISIVFFALALLTVALRLWARLVVRKSAGLDDVLIVLALIPTACLSITTSLATRTYGFDRHTWDLSSELGIKSRAILTAIFASILLGTGLTKISILFFYRRLTARAVSNTFRYIMWANIAYVIGTMVAFMIITFAACRPIKSFWLQGSIEYQMTHVPGKDYKCVNEPATIIAICAITMSQDLLVCILPMTLFWKMQMPRRQKIALSAIFGVGIFLSITACLRIYTVVVIYYRTYDVTWHAWPSFLWTIIEANLGIVCASAPALKVFVKRYFKSSAWNTPARGVPRPDSTIESKQKDRRKRHEDSPYLSASSHGGLDGSWLDMELNSITSLGLPAIKDGEHSRKAVPKGYENVPWCKIEILISERFYVPNDGMQRLNA